MWKLEESASWYGDAVKIRASKVLYICWDALHETKRGPIKIIDITPNRHDLSTAAIWRQFAPNSALRSETHSKDELDA